MIGGDTMEELGRSREGAWIEIKSNVGMSVPLVSLP